MTDTNEVKVLVFDLDQTLVSTDLEKILNIVIPIYISGRKGICYGGAWKLFYDELERLKRRPKHFSLAWKQYLKLLELNMMI